MIAFYITAHGYGHAARSLEVIDALLEHCPVTVVSEVSEELLTQRLGDRLNLRRRSFDVGIVQVDSVRGDQAETLNRVHALMAQSPALIAEEMEFFRQARVRAVLVDAPSLPLEAAHEYGIPGLAVTSFGWDFIYEHFTAEDPAWIPVCRWFSQGYAKATHFLRYPLSEPMPSIGSREAIPLVSRPGMPRQLLLGSRDARPWVLLWFHQLDLDETARRHLENLPYVFFNWPNLGWTGPNIRCPAPGTLEFSDLVASVDVVLSKPGFGIISDCIANHKPLVYVPRDDFRESELLEKGIRRYLRSASIPIGELYRANLQPFIEQALQAPPPAETLPCGGARLIAERILERARSH